MHLQHHSWVMTIALALALLFVGAFVFSMCRAERTANAATALSDH